MSVLLQLDLSLKAAVFELVTVARLFDELGRDEDSKCALELARDVCGMHPSGLDLECATD